MYHFETVLSYWEEKTQQSANNNENTGIKDTCCMEKHESHENEPHFSSTKLQVASKLYLCIELYVLNSAFENRYRSEKIK